MKPSDHETNVGGGFSGPILMFWLALFGGVGYMFYSQRDWVGIGCTAAIACACFSGYRIGAIRLAATVLGFALAIGYAPQLGTAQEHWFTQWFGTTGQLNHFLSIAVAGLLITLLVTIVVSLAARQFVKNRPRLSLADKWFGFFIGGFEGTFAMLLLLGGILAIEPLVTQNGEPDALTASIIVKTMASNTRQSQLGPVIEQYDLFKHFPDLNQFEKIQQTVQVFRSSKPID